MKKFLAMILSLTLLCGLLAGCGSGSTTTSGTDVSSSGDGSDSSEVVSERQTEEGTLTVGIVSTNGGFDHVGTHGQDDQLNILMAWDSLWRRDDITGELVNCMVDDYEWVDSTHLRITLKEGITAYDGEEITAEDVLYTYSRYLDEGSNLSAYYTQYDLENSEIDPDDPLTFTLAFTEEYGPGISMMTDPIYPKDWCENEGQDDALWFDSPNSTGPYVVVENVDGAYITFALRENYWGDSTGMAETVTIRYYSEESTMYIDFCNGVLDACYGLSSSDVEELNATDGVVCVTASQNDTMLLVLPENIEYFDDENVRMAIAHAIDYEAVATVGYDTLWFPATSVLPSTVNYYVDSGLPYEYDPEYAAEMMAQSAYPDGFTLNVVVTNATENVNMMTAIQAYLAVIGIDVTIESYDIPTAVPMMQAGETGLALSHCQGGATSRDPEMILNTMNTGTSNMSVRISDELYNEYYRTGLYSVDDDIRAEAYANLQERVSELYRILPICEPAYAYAYHDYISICGGATPSAPDLTQIRFA